MMKKTMHIVVECSELDEAIEKVSQLIRLLNEAQKIINSLGSKEEEDQRPKASDK